MKNVFYELVVISESRTKYKDVLIVVSKGLKCLMNVMTIYILYFRIKFVLTNDEIIVLFHLEADDSSSNCDDP